MLAIALAFSASIAWGVCDFLGGVKSRDFAAVVVLLISQAAGLVAIALLVAARGDAPPDGGSLALAALAGAIGSVALTALYRGLAIGPMSVVAPIAATGAIVPVAVGLVTGEKPTAFQNAGVALALVGIVLASRDAGRSGETESRLAAGVALGLAAAAGTGAFLVTMDAAADRDPYWAVLVNKFVAVAFLTIAVAALRPRLASGGRALASLAVIGVLDVTGTTLVAAALTKGLVGLVSVLASLYPVTTALLAHTVLRERIGRGQQAGVAAALGGVALIAAG